MSRIGAENIIEYDLPNGFVVLIEGENDEAMQRATTRGGIAKSSQDFNRAFDSISSTLNIVASKLRESNSDAVEVSFGIRSLPQGTFVITKGIEEANFNIKLIWKNKESY
jgi:hypothetical protein